MPVTIFFCYAREDEALLKKLKTHLRPLQRQGFIDVWYDRDISAGTEWEQEIKQHLNTAQIILLLVSPDFMDSDYCYGIEMQRALERHQNGEARVIPIILRPVYWHGEPLGKLQALPIDGKPVTDPEWHDQDRAFYSVANDIHKMVVQWAAPPAFALPVVAEGLPQRVAQASSLSPPVQQIQPMPSSPCSAAVLAYIKKHQLDTDSNLIPTVRNFTRYMKNLSKEQIAEAVTDLVNTGQITEQRRGKAVVYVLAARKEAQS